MLYSRSLLVVHSVYGVVSVLIPSSQFTGYPLVASSLFSVSVDMFLFCEWIHLLSFFFFFWIPHVSEIMFVFGLLHLM